MIYDKTLEVANEPKHLRTLTHEMTFELVGYLRDKIITSLNKELEFFGLGLSEQTKSSFFVLTIKVLLGAQCERHREPIQQIINDFEERREAQRNFFIIQTIQNTQMNTDVARTLVGNIELFLRSIALKQGQQIFESKIEKIRKTTSRYQLQKILDAKLDRNTSPRELYDYIVNPRKKIVELFDTIWLKAETEILLEAEKIHQKQLSIIQVVKINLEMFLLKLRTIEIEDFDGSVLDLFKTSHQKTDNKIFLEGSAAMQLVFAILNCEPFSSTIINDIEFTLKYKSIIPPDIIPIQIEEELHSVVVEGLRSQFYKCSISNIMLFIEAFYNKISELEKRIAKKDFALPDLDVKDLQSAYKKRAVGCTESCPCCGRPCDVDHFAYLHCMIGSGVNKHACSLGHQLRGMNGYKENFTNKASLRFCEEMKDHDRVIDNGQNLSWQEFKEKQSTWNFETTDLTFQDLQTLREKLFYVWNNIGERICSERYPGSGMKYVASNYKRSEKPRIHFIIAIDGSYSMKGKPWEDLMGCLGRIFLNKTKRNGKRR